MSPGISYGVRCGEDENEAPLRADDALETAASVVHSCPIDNIVSLLLSSSVSDFKELLLSSTWTSTSNAGRRLCEASWSSAEFIIADSSDRRLFKMMSFFDRAFGFSTTDDDAARADSDVKSPDDRVDRLRFFFACRQPQVLRRFRLALLSVTD